MRTNELHVIQSIDSNVLIVLVALVVLVMGYGFYRRMKLREKKR